MDQKHIEPECVCTNDDSQSSLVHTAYIPVESESIQSPSPSPSYTHTPYKPWHPWKKDGYYMVGIRNDIYKWTGWFDWIPNTVTSTINKLANTELPTDMYMFGAGKSYIKIGDTTITDQRNVLVYVPEQRLELDVEFGASASFTRKITIRFSQTPAPQKLWILECSGTPLLSDVAGGFATDSVSSAFGSPYAYTQSKRLYHHTSGTVKPVWSYFYFNPDGSPTYSVTI
jgi:hypothetical protein